MWFVFFFFFFTSFGFGFGFIVPFGGSTQAIPGQTKQGTPSLGGPQASGVTGFRKPCTGSPPCTAPRGNKKSMYHSHYVWIAWSHQGHLSPTGVQTLGKVAPLRWGAV